jgi:LysR family glycine cleavage system transcriptional activator
LHEEGFDGWPLWFKERGEGTAPDTDVVARGPNFSDGYVLLRAAATGIGIVLASNVLAQPFIADRTLAWLAADSIQSPFNYVAASSERGLKDPDIASVFTWIVAQSAA